LLWIGDSTASPRRFGPLSPHTQADFLLLLAGLKNSTGGQRGFSRILIVLHMPPGEPSMSKERNATKEVKKKAALSPKEKKAAKKAKKEAKKH